MRDQQKDTHKRIKGSSSQDTTDLTVDRLLSSAKGIHLHDTSVSFTLRFLLAAHQTGDHTGFADAIAERDGDDDGDALLTSKVKNTNNNTKKKKHKPHRIPPDRVRAMIEKIRPALRALDGNLPSTWPTLRHGAPGPVALEEFPDENLLRQLYDMPRHGHDDSLVALLDPQLATVETGPQAARIFLRRTVVLQRGDASNGQPWPPPKSEGFYLSDHDINQNRMLFDADNECIDVSRLQQFIRGWRQCFVEHMQPKAMPDGWQLDRDEVTSRLTSPSNPNKYA